MVTTGIVNLVCFALLTHLALDSVKLRWHEADTREDPLSCSAEWQDWLWACIWEAFAVGVLLLH